MPRIEIKEGRIVGKMKRDGGETLIVKIKNATSICTIAGARFAGKNGLIKIAPTGGAVIATLKKSGDTRPYALTYKVLVEEGRRKKILELMLQKTYFSRVWGRKLPKREK